MNTSTPSILRPPPAPPLTVALALLAACGDSVHERRGAASSAASTRRATVSVDAAVAFATVTWSDNGAVEVDDGESFEPLAEGRGGGLAGATARAGDALVATRSSDARLRGHTFRRRDGGIAVILINDDPGSDLIATVTISNADLETAGTRFHLDGASHSTVTTRSALAGEARAFTVTVPAWSETAIVIAGAGGGTGSDAVPDAVIAPRDTGTIGADAAPRAAGFALARSRAGRRQDSLR